MYAVKNPLYILEAAKNIVTKEQQYANDKPKDSKLTLVNDEIVRIKEFIKKNNVEKSFCHIENFKQFCIEKQIAEKSELHDIQNISMLLDFLFLKRKKLKEFCIENNGNTEFLKDPFTQDLFLGSTQYTIRALCKDFSCTIENITPDYVENEKNKCCIKLTYLISKYEYCDSLTKTIEDINSKFSINYNNDDIPIFDRKSSFDFDKISKTIEQITHSYTPDLELNRILLGSLSHFKQNIVKEMDTYCNKIDLANNFLYSIEKSRNMEFCK
jgi:hypothetical protein